jgi:hypothetical protein
MNKACLVDEYIKTMQVLYVVFFLISDKASEFGRREKMTTKTNLWECYKLPDDFKPITFFYLNPECFDQTMQGASEYFANHNSILNPLHYSMESIPDDFHAETFLCGNKDGLQIGSLNQIIMQNMIANGYTRDELFNLNNNNMRILPTIEEPIHIRDVATWTFGFDDPSFLAHSHRLVVGDDVKIHCSINDENDQQPDNINRNKNNNNNNNPILTQLGHKQNTNGGISILAKVTNVDASVGTFQLSNYLPNANYFFMHNNNNVSETPSLVLYGQRLYDSERLAHINYVRGNRALFSTTIDPSIDHEFNPDLYRLLYPDARCMDNVTAFLDYSKHLNRGEGRVGKSSQITLTNDLDSDFIHLANEKIRWTSNTMSMNNRRAIWSSNTSQQALSMAGWGSNVIMHDHLRFSDLKQLPFVHILSNASIGPSYDLGLDHVRLRVHGAIRANDYLVTSDLRCKDNITCIQPVSALHMIEKTVPVTYTMKHEKKEEINIQHKHRKERYGFIAQSLGKVDCNLTPKTADFIPDIMKRVNINKFGCVHLPSHNLKLGDQLKLIDDDDGSIQEDGISVEHIVEIRQVPCDDTFVIHDGRLSNRSMFIYGRKVSDFHTVDYTQLIPLLCGSIQALSARIASLDEKLFHLTQ